MQGILKIDVKEIHKKRGSRVKIAFKSHFFEDTVFVSDGKKLIPLRTTTEILIEETN